MQEGKSAAVKHCRGFDKKGDYSAIGARLPVKIILIDAVEFLIINGNADAVTSRGSVVDSIILEIGVLVIRQLLFPNLLGIVV